MESFHLRRAYTHGVYILRLFASSVNIMTFHLNCTIAVLQLFESSHFISRIIIHQSMVLQNKYKAYRRLSRNLSLKIGKTTRKKMYSYLKFKTKTRNKIDKTIGSVENCNNNEESNTPHKCTC